MQGDTPCTPDGFASLNIREQRDLDGRRTHHPKTVTVVPVDRIVEVTNRHVSAARIVVPRPAPQHAAISIIYFIASSLEIS